MRILIATDAWRPQVNGVVHTLEATAQAAKSLGAEVSFLTAEGFPTVRLPSYPGIRIALRRARQFRRTGLGRGCAGFITPGGAPWSPRPRLQASCAAMGLTTSCGGPVASIRRCFIRTVHAISG